MLSIFDKGAPPPCTQPFNLAAHVLAAGAATPDKIALSIVSPSGAERWSFARMRAAVLGTATTVPARSHSSTGRQSAVITTQGRSGSRVQAASATTGALTVSAATA